MSNTYTHTHTHTPANSVTNGRTKKKEEESSAQIHKSWTRSNETQNACMLNQHKGHTPSTGRRAGSWSTLLHSVFFVWHQIKKPPQTVQCSPPQKPHQHVNTYTNSTTTKHLISLCHRSSRSCVFSTVPTRSILQHLFWRITSVQRLGSFAFFCGSWRCCCSVASFSWKRCGGCPLTRVLLCAFFLSVCAPLQCCTSI
jgi:hypothetical protein